MERKNNKKEKGREHKTTYSLKYDFSSKIACGHCNSTYVRRQGTKRKDGTAPIYWKCFQQVDEKRYCEKSKFIRDDVLKDMFVELYNLIVINKHQTKEKDNDEHIGRCGKSNGLDKRQHTGRARLLGRGARRCACRHEVG